MTALPNPIASAPSSLERTATPPRALLEKGNPGAGRDHIGEHSFGEWLMSTEGQIARLHQRTREFHDTANDEPYPIDRPKPSKLALFPPLEPQETYDPAKMDAVDRALFVALLLVIALGTVVFVWSVINGWTA